MRSSIIFASPANGSEVFTSLPSNSSARFKASGVPCFSYKAVASIIALEYQTEPPIPFN
jgi:hypothetical protein